MRPLDRLTRAWVTASTITLLAALATVGCAADDDAELASGGAQTGALAAAVPSDTAAPPATVATEPPPGSPADAPPWSAPENPLPVPTAPTPPEDHQATDLIPEGFEPQIDPDAGQWLLTLDDAAQFEDYPVFYAGDEVLGQPLLPNLDLVRGGPSAALREQGVRSRNDKLTLFYGDCDTSQGPCMSPVTIMNQPACAGFLQKFDFGYEPGAVTSKMARVDVGGQALGVAANDGQVRLFTGDAAITIQSDTTDHAVHVARALVPLNASAKEMMAGGGLPEPSESVLTGAGC